MKKLHAYTILSLFAIVNFTIFFILTNFLVYTSYSLISFEIINCKRITHHFTYEIHQISSHIYLNPPLQLLPTNPVYPSYYYPHLGILYEKLPSIASFSFNSPIFFSVGSAQILLISGLPNEESNYLSEIYTSRLSWNTRFSLLEAEVRNSLIRNNIKLPIPPHDSSFSTVYLWKNPSAQSYSIYGHNICYDLDQSQIILFLPENEYFNVSIYKDAFFRWGWKLRVINGEIKMPISSREGVAIVHPAFRSHIYHALEGIGQVLHKFFSAEEYPFFSEVINTGLSNSDMPWIQEVMNILFKSFSFLSNPPLFTSDTVKSHPSWNGSTMCFDSVLFMDRMKQAGDGGFLSGFLGTDWLKALAYKQFDIKLSDNRSGKYILLFAQRTNTRQWENPERILHHLKLRFNESLIIQNYYFSARPLKQQVQTFFHTDILMTAHGAGETNAIFMLPHSVMIEVHPPHFSENTLANVHLHARLHYISVSNYDYEAIKKYKKPSPDEEYVKGTYNKIHKKYIQLNLTTNPFSIVSAVDDAIAFLDNSRYKIVNDYLSPLFI